MQECTLNFSVITCAYTEKRWDALVACIESVKRQKFRPLEIIVSIDHNEGLYERARAYFPNKIKVIRNSEAKGLSGTRNSGISKSKGDVIAFLDDDAIAEPEWLGKLHDNYRDASVMGVGGIIKPIWDGSKPAWFPEEFNWVVGCTYRGVSEKTESTRNLIGCNMSFRTDIFENVGGFRSGIGRIGVLPYGCEETELCIRANQKYPTGRFVHEPMASVSHHVPKSRMSFKYFRQRCYAEGISKAMITSLVGAQDGLSSERSYTFKTLPRGVLDGFLGGIRDGDLSGINRAMAIMIGFFLTALGYLFGKTHSFVRQGNFGIGGYKLLKAPAKKPSEKIFKDQKEIE